MIGLEWLETGISAFAGGIAGALVSFLVTRYHIGQLNLASSVDRACRYIYELEERGIRYWSKSHSNEEAIMIKSLLKRVAADLSVLLEHEWIIHYEVEDKIIELRRSITDGNFEVADRPDDPGRTDRISTAANSLCTALRRSAKMAR